MIQVQNRRGVYKRGYRRVLLVLLSEAPELSLGVIWNLCPHISVSTVARSLGYLEKCNLVTRSFPGSISSGDRRVFYSLTDEGRIYALRVLRLEPGWVSKR
jgi:DNA-binding MarR family transcriptional regulator